jgi:ribosomal protein S18 acetylase RimI-like enzyme
MIIRKANHKDLQKIQELNNLLFELELASYDKYLIKNWPFTTAGKKYFENAIEEDCVLVAEIKGQVVGYLLGSISDISYYDFPIAELCNMCIDSNYRKQGIGRALYTEFEKFYNKQGINHFTVTASFKNESAKAFYKSIGFEEANLTFVKF